jgi:hypothetical protein
MRAVRRVVTVGVLAGALPTAPATEAAAVGIDPGGGLTF